MVNELEVRDRELARLRAQQEATGRILQVISNSLPDPQPVFNMIAGYAVDLCDGRFGGVLTFDGEHLHLRAQHGLTPDEAEVYRLAFPRPADTDSAVGRAVLKRAFVHIPDVCVDAVYELGALARTGNVRSIVAVPMLRNGNPIGGIVVWRSRPVPFDSVHIVLLESFAVQAVIAMESVRLSLELATRRGDVLGVVEQTAVAAGILLDAPGSPGNV